MTLNVIINANADVQWLVTIAHCAQDHVRDTCSYCLWANAYASVQPQCLNTHTYMIWLAKRVLV